MTSPYLRFRFWQWHVNLIDIIIIIVNSKEKLWGLFGKAEKLGDYRKPNISRQAVRAKFARYKLSVWSCAQRNAQRGILTTAKTM